jgi:hypothetical protein
MMGYAPERIFVMLTDDVSGSGEWCTMTTLANALRPLLQPAPADVPTPDWATAPEWAQWWAANPNGCAWWYEQQPWKGMNWWNPTAGRRDFVPATHPTAFYPEWNHSVTQRPQEQPRTFANPNRDDLQAALAGYQREVAQQDARLLAVDKRREIAERQLDEARQANAQLTAQVATYRAQADEQRQAAVEAAQRADAAEAQNAEHRRTWNTIPWADLESVLNVVQHEIPDALLVWRAANSPFWQGGDDD